MIQEIFEWLLLLGRWLHITVGITWIGTSIFFMWLDRTFVPNEKSERPGHVGELWMVHGGGFYHVEKLLMGPTKVPEHLHWFKWESYWTWMSGIFLISMIFYTSGGSALLDRSVSDISYFQAVLIGVLSILGSWVFYDTLWENKLTQKTPLIGHIFTLAWFAGMSYFLCHTLSGRAAYIHIGAMLGTWMTANVAMRIIPRQVKMVEASKKGEPINPDWGKNAKNRSTHNTYFTLPVIFIMLSNHFPSTYGHPYNWLVLLVISAAGAAIREFFVVRIKNPPRSKVFGAVGACLLLGLIIFARENGGTVVSLSESPSSSSSALTSNAHSDIHASASQAGKGEVRGVVHFEGPVPPREKLLLPPGCGNPQGGDIYSNEILIKDGKLKNVLVRVIKGLEGKKFTDIPTDPAILDQRGCLYEPRVVVARVGQRVEFINSDPTFHNVKSISKNNENFNVAMPNKDERFSKVFDHPEIFLQTKCSVHPWMGAYIAVVDHPYFSVTNDAGEFSIRGLPAGHYTIELWHEIFGTQEKEVTLEEGNGVNLDFTFQAKNAKAEK